MVSIFSIRLKTGFKTPAFPPHHISKETSLEFGAHFHDFQSLRLQAFKQKHTFTLHFLEGFCYPSVMLTLILILLNSCNGGMRNVMQLGGSKMCYVMSKFDLGRPDWNKE